MPHTFTIRAITPEDREWIRDLLTERWGAPEVVSRGHVHQVDTLPGFVACGDRTDERCGLTTYNIAGPNCELVTLDSIRERCGVGTGLIDAVANVARAAGCTRLWLITTNDNTPALRFYQRRGFRLVALHANALEQSRRLKPQIPMHGMENIPLRDELQLERML